jgi:predicted nucleic acid-binding protein
MDTRSIHGRRAAVLQRRLGRILDVVAARFHNHRIGSQNYTTLPDQIFLRSADCLHLVTALHHSFTEIYTYDAHQTAAAVALGIKPQRA